MTENGAGTDGPFTRFGGYSAEFGQGFTASVDIYLDINWGERLGLRIIRVAANRARTAITSATSSST